MPEVTQQQMRELVRLGYDIRSCEVRTEKNNAEKQDALNEIASIAELERSGGLNSQMRERKTALSLAADTAARLAREALQEKETLMDRLSAQFGITGLQ